MNAERTARRDDLEYALGMLLDPHEHEGVLRLRLGHVRLLLHVRRARVHEDVVEEEEVQLVGGLLGEAVRDGQNAVPQELAVRLEETLWSTVSAALCRC